MPDRPSPAAASGPGRLSLAELARALGAPYATLVQAIGRAESNPDPDPVRRPPAPSAVDAATGRRFYDLDPFRAWYATQRRGRGRPRNAAP